MRNNNSQKNKNNSIDMSKDDMLIWLRLRNYKLMRLD